MANNFWDTVGPGLLSTAGGFYGARQEQKQAEEDLRRSQGPLYDQMMGMAGTSFGQAAGMDPRAMAADRFKAQQALVEPGNEAQRLQLMRELQKKGMLGAGSFAPVAGTTATPGVAVNPQMAALLAAQEGAKSRAAYESLGEGEQYLDRLLGRGSKLASTATTARGENLAQRQRAGVKSQGGIGSQLLSAVLKDPKMAMGMLGQGLDFLKGLGGGGAGTAAAPISFEDMFLGGGGYAADWPTDWLSSGVYW